MELGCYFQTSSRCFRHKDVERKCKIHRKYWNGQRETDTSPQVIYHSTSSAFWTGLTVHNRRFTDREISNRVPFERLLNFHKFPALKPWIEKLFEEEGIRLQMEVFYCRKTERKLNAADFHLTFMDIDVCLPFYRLHGLFLINDHTTTTTSIVSHRCSLSARLLHNYLSEEFFEVTSNESWSLVYRLWRKADCTRFNWEAVNLSVYPPSSTSFKIHLGPFVVCNFPAKCFHLSPNSCSTLVVQDDRGSFSFQIQKKDNFLEH